MRCLKHVFQVLSMLFFVKRLVELIELIGVEDNVLS
jgi:hypothetical protein